MSTIRPSLVSFTFVRSFIRSNIYSFIQTFLLSFSLVIIFSHSFIHINSFIHIHSFTFVQLLILSFTHSFIHSGIHSFTQAFIHSFIQVAELCTSSCMETVPSFTLLVFPHSDKQFSVISSHAPWPNNKQMVRETTV